MLVIVIASNVRPWKALSNTTTAGRPVAQRATFTAFSTASAPEFTTVTVNPLPDSVTITAAEYRISKQRLILNATSSVISPAVVLKLAPYVTTLGTTFDPCASLGCTFTNNGGGLYLLDIVGAPEPAIPPATPAIAGRDTWSNTSLLARLISMRQRMADRVRDVLAKAGHQVEIQVRNDTESLQRGAALALFADEGEAVRLGADQAGALRRSAESIGAHVAKQLLDDLMSGATLDRFAADQVIPFAALAEGESRFIIPTVTDHVLTSAWLAETFLDAHVHIEGRQLAIQGVGFWPNGTRKPS